MGNFGWLAFGITHGYITTGGCNDCPHYADDIGTPFHTPVTALFSGTVIHQATHLAWGSEIFIQPDDSSLPQYYYYHQDVLYTLPGQHVNAGQVIGLSGGQNSGGSNPTTPEYSSGPHTHVGFFTKWVNTGLGTRPYGPDITPYVTALAKGQTPPAGPGNDTSGNTSGQNTGTNIQNLNDLATAFLLKVGVPQAAIDAMNVVSTIGGLNILSAIGVLIVGGPLVLLSALFIGLVGM